MLVVVKGNWVEEKQLFVELSDFMLVEKEETLFYTKNKCLSLMKKGSRNDVDM